MLTLPITMLERWHLARLMSAWGSGDHSAVDFADMSKCGISFSLERYHLVEFRRHHFGVRHVGVSVKSFDMKTIDDMMTIDARLSRPHVAKLLAKTASHNMLGPTVENVALQELI